MVFPQPIFHTYACHCTIGLKKPAKAKMASTRFLNKHSTSIKLEDLKALVKRGHFLRNLFRFRELELTVPRLKYLPLPFFTAISLRLLSRRRSLIKDELGQEFPITFSAIFKLLGKWLTNGLQAPFLLKQVKREVASLSKVLTSEEPKYKLDLSHTPIYLRMDLLFGISAGGSVSHISGVFNNLDQAGTKPILLSTDTIPGIRSDLVSLSIQPDNDFQDYPELSEINFTTSMASQIENLLTDTNASFLYQRYSAYNYSGTLLARRLKIPLILEYNGSEIWVRQNWSRGLKYKKLAERIELLNLNYADVVVVVSRALKDELLSRGIDSDKILTNPNGVDSNLYSSHLDGSIIRSRFDLKEKTVLGFIGTFGPWHGAEVLARAYGLLLKKYPEYKQTTRLFMIGDGKTMPLVKAETKDLNIDANVILTGTVLQEEGPKYLAACDILVSPHVPNTDGTPFFGSPTKLFEYMAMGKGIIASDLDQIGEVLEHDHTAWMVKPGDAETLMLGLKTMIDNPDTSKRLGEAARREVVAKYTWKEHTRKIIEKLKERCLCD
jgi:glycosyltransferase involved in cell wall biosynthesis